MIEETMGVSWFASTSSRALRVRPPYRRSTRLARPDSDTNFRAATSAGSESTGSRAIGVRSRDRARASRTYSTPSRNADSRTSGPLHLGATNISDSRSQLRASLQLDADERKFDLRLQAAHDSRDALA